MINILKTTISTINLVLIFLLTSLTACHSNTEQVHPNVLFIAIDDLRPELGCYGQEHILSPNIDRIAQTGIVFNKTYCNVPVCGASRASLLTGVRPGNKRFKTFLAKADDDLPGHLSLPRHLKNSGYYTVSLGKVYHQKMDDTAGWSERPWHPKTSGVTRDYILPASIDTVKNNSTKKKNGNGPAWEAAEGDDDIYNDGKTTLKALQKLEQLNEQNQPFFLAVGYYKPHLPFNAPKKYWDMYNRDSINLAMNPYIPQNAPNAAIHNNNELRKQYHGVPEEAPLPNDYARSLRHGYYACISYIDAQIGMLVSKLKELELDNNTIIVIWGDHGWNLGEHTMWCKHNNFITSLRAPLIINIPGKTSGTKSDAISEFVDSYPTITELCGVETPSHCEGSSLVKAIEDHSYEGKKATYSKWHNGLTIRTKRYQYTEWTNPKTKEVYARMLYDHVTDPNENMNIAELPENQDLVKELSTQLQTWWANYLENDKEREAIAKTWAEKKKKEKKGKKNTAIH